VPYLKRFEGNLSLRVSASADEGVEDDFKNRSKALNVLASFDAFGYRCEMPSP
jgi:hypothetical protein